MAESVADSILIYGLGGPESSKEADAMITQAREAGFSVVYVCDRETPLAVRADFFYANPEWSFSRLLEIAREHSVKLAILASDFPSPLVGRLNRELSLPGPTDAQYLLLADKLRWQETALANGLAMPRQRFVHSASEFEDPEWQFPIIVKPSRSSGNVDPAGIGYRFYRSLREFGIFLKEKGLLEEFLLRSREAGPLGRYFIQEAIDFLHWRNVHVTIVNGVLLRHEISDRLTWAFPNSVNYFGTYAPVSASGAELDHMEKLEKTLLQTVGLRNTALNYDLITSRDGQIYSVDVNVRSSGTFGVVSALRGATYFGEIFRAFLGQSANLDFHFPAYIRRTLTPKEGPLKEISFPSEAGISVLGLEKIRTGFNVPSHPGRFTFPVEMIAVDPDLQNCFGKMEKWLGEVKYRYD